MIIMWTVSQFNFYLIMFLANTFEQVYLTALFVGLAGLLAYICSGFLVKCFGTKATLCLSFVTSAIGGFLILVYGLQHEDSALFPVLFFISKFGASCAVGVCYTGNAEVFPAEITASTLGICQVFARFFSALQFLTMQMKQPAPMLIYTIGSVIAVIASLFIRNT